VADFEAVDAYSYNMSPADKRTVRRIIFEHLDYIVSELRVSTGKAGFEVS